MAKKKIQEEKITLGLAGPAIWSGVTKISGLEGKDFDEGEGDISPVTIKDAANFAEKMMQDGRRDAGTGNEFYPDETNATASSSKKGDSLPVPKSGAKGNIYKEAADLGFTGGKYQEANTAVGVTPNFFTSDDPLQQAAAFIDKTGADPTKGGSDLPDKKVALEIATSAQLTSRNDYSPDGAGPASPGQYEDLNPKSIVPADALSDELYKGGNASAPSPGTLKKAIAAAKIGGASPEAMSWTQNAYKPASTVSIVDTHKVGDPISPAASGETGNVFASTVDHDDDPMTPEVLPETLQATGLGVPSVTATPGTSAQTGQTLGSFFTQTQIDAVLDKTGGTAAKKGSDLFSPAKMEASTAAAQTQLGVGNIYKPDAGLEAGEYTTAALVEAAEGGTTKSTSEDKGLPGVQPVPGVHDDAVLIRDPNSLAKEAHSPESGSPGLSENTTHPKQHGDDPEFTDPNTHIEAGPLDVFFKTSSGLTFTGGQYRDGESTPGVGNSFYTAEQLSDLQITAYPNSLMSKADTPGPGGGLPPLTKYTQAQLADKNPYDPPNDSYTARNTSADKASTDQLYIKDQGTLGKFEKSIGSVGAAATPIENQGTLSNLISSAQQAAPTVDLLGDAREPTHSNTYKPQSTTTFVDSNKVGNSLPLAASGLTGKIFASTVDDDGKDDTAKVVPQALQSAGMGVPSITATPGTDTASGQTLGTFFTQTQIDAVLDKKGSTGTFADKKGHDLFSPTNVTKHKTQTQTQLEDSTNPNTPSSSHAEADGDFIWPKPTNPSNIKDVTYPQPPTVAGAFTEQTDLSSLASAKKQQSKSGLVPATGYLQDNPYHPKELDDADGSTDMDFSADTKIISGEDDVFFAADTTNIDATGLGVPSIAATPGVVIDSDGDGTPDETQGQTLGTFFTQDQIAGVLDKTGKTPEKLGSKLLSHPGAIATSTQAQLETSNVNDPDNKHATNIDFVPHDVDDASISTDQDVLLPDPEVSTAPGVYAGTAEGGEAAATLSTNALGIAGSAKLSLNPNKPKSGASATLLNSPTLSKSTGPMFTEKDESSFALDTEMVDMPGTGPNFFTSDGNMPVPVTDSPGLGELDSPGDGAEDGGFSGNVQLELDGSQNVWNPDKTYAGNASVGTMGLEDFPDYDEISTANPEKMGSLFNADQKLGKFSKSASEATEDIPALVEIITETEGLKNGLFGGPKNTFHPDLSFSQITAGETKERRAENKLGPNDQSNYFINDQDTEMDGASTSDRHLIKDPDEEIATALTGENPSQILTSVPEKGTKKVPAPGAGTSESYASPFGVKDEEDKADPSFGEILSKVYSMLEESNMYSPSSESPFIKNSQSKSEATATQGLFTIQRVLGKFITEPTDSETSGTRVTADDMSYMANSLLVRGTGDFGGSLGLMSDLTAAGAVLANPVEQLGLAGIDIANFHFPSLKDAEDRGKMAASATGNKTFMQLDGSASLVSMGTGGRLPSERNPMSGVSHGQLNNWLEPFGNGIFLDSIGMLWLGVLSVAGIFIAGFIIQLITESVPGLEERKGKGSDPTELVLGKYQKFDKKETSRIGGRIVEIIKDCFRIPNIDNEFGDAIGSGMLLMIGFPGNFMRKDVESSLATGAGIVDFAMNLFTSPAYYANYMRTITMSFQNVMGSFADIAGGGFTSGFEKFFVAIDNLVNSKLYQFVMISAGVGDANMKSLYGAPGVSIEDSLYQLKTAEISVNPGRPTNKGFVQKLAAVAQLRKNITRWGGSSRNPLSLSTFPASNVSDVRLGGMAPLRQLEASKENVQKMEQALDAEYMPFYFHDLRTHEIISMPAFVTSFDESFAVNYSSTPSYGRQDPVRIYNGTERSINLSFKLVAFSEEDFTSMWYTINKFVSMLYPQYSKGIQRTLKNTDPKKSVSFIQPFSQVPAASPMIRIRLGDLYKSNYSATALRNLFGYNAEESNTDFKIGDDTAGKALAGQKMVEYEYQDIIRKTKKIYDEAMAEKGKKPALLIAAITEQKLRVEYNGATEFELAESSKKKIKIENGKDNEARKTLKKFVSFTGDASFKLRTNVMMVLVDEKKLSVAEKAAAAAFSKPKEDKITGTFVLIRKGSGLGPKGRAIIDVEEADIKHFNKINTDWSKDQKEGSDIIKELAVADIKDNYAAELKKSEDFIETAGAFFKPANNAIVRSFNATKGKGLAGFITTLSFDYSDSTWEVAADSRAPKTVGLTMAFAPIHDTPLGIDYQGKMRSLSHPVGKITQPQESLTDPNLVTNFGGVYDEPLDMAAGEADYNSVITALEKKARRGEGPEEGPGLGL